MSAPAISPPFSRTARSSIVDRKKDILITSGGKNIAPAAVENALRCSPYISEVIVFGDQRKYITALIEVDFENVAQWARQRQIPYTGYMSLSQDSRVASSSPRKSSSSTSACRASSRSRSFRMLTKELVPEDGDTTPTRKVKRAHAYKLFGQSSRTCMPKTATELRAEFVV